MTGDNWKREIGPRPMVKIRSRLTEGDISFFIFPPVLFFLPFPPVIFRCFRRFYPRLRSFRNTFPLIFLSVIVRSLSFLRFISCFLTFRVCLFSFLFAILLYIAKVNRWGRWIVSFLSYGGLGNK